MTCKVVELERSKIKKLKNFQGEPIDENFDELFYFHIPIFKYFFHIFIRDFSPFAWSKIALISAKTLLAGWDASTRVCKFRCLKISKLK